MKTYKVYLNFREEDEAEDEVDSDFSIDENDEPVSDTEQEGPKKKRRLVTKAYKEPKPVLHAQSTPRERKIKQSKQDKIFIDSIGNTSTLAKLNVSFRYVHCNIVHRKKIDTSLYRCKVSSYAETFA